jgi:hypothetical protein
MVEPEVLVTAPWKIAELCAMTVLAPLVLR